MKVIFLDIDGVLCTVRSHIARGDLGLMRALDREGVGLLNQVVDDQTRFVLSSTWRLLHDREWMEDHLRMHGWIGQFHDDWRTKEISSMRGRGGEIAEWLGRHPDTDRFAIVDDDSDMLPEQMSMFVHTSTDDGFSWKNFMELSEVLHGDENAWLRMMQAKQDFYEVDSGSAE